MKSYSTLYESPEVSWGGAVLLFDGECCLCHAFVRFLARSGRSDNLRMAPLQSQFAEKSLSDLGMEKNDRSSLIFITRLNASGATILLRTDGAIAALRCSIGDNLFLRGLERVPVGVRDLVYRFIAKARFILFGACSYEKLLHEVDNAFFSGIKLN